MSKKQRNSTHKQSERSSLSKNYTFHNTCVVRSGNFLNQIALVLCASSSAVRFIQNHGEDALSYPQERDSFKHGARRGHVDKTRLLRDLMGILRSMAARAQNHHS